jgi:hypothetical protein
VSEIESLAVHLEALERELLAHAVRVSSRAAELLADDFIEFGSSGRVFDKAKILAALASEIDNPLSSNATDFKVMRLGPDTALVTYRTYRNAEPSIGALRSSIWKRHNGQWQMIFHQGTKSEVRDDQTI